ncbi:MAG: MFS transporter [Butyrivibrio sp.]|nr:MFS transporter [Butyrivibrio sp.]
MNKKIEITTLWNRYYLLTVLINVLISFSFYMVSSIMSKHLVNIGIDVAVAGVIVGLFSLTSLVCRPFSGILADNFSNVTLLRISNVLMAIGLAGFAFVTNTQLLIFFRIINGAGFALLGTSVITLATRFVPDDRRGEGIGYLGLGMALSSAVAPGFGITIADHLGMKATFIAASFMCVFAIFLLFFIEDTSSNKKTKSGFKLSLKDMIGIEAIPYTLIAGAFSFINGIIASYLVLYSDELGVSGISVYFTVCAVMLMIARPLSGKLMDKKGIKVTVIPGMICTVISMFMLGRVTRLIPILISGAIRSFGQGAAQPSLQVGCINKCGKERSGVATSTYYLGGDIFQGTAPMIGGMIIGKVAGIKGYRLSFDIAGVLLLAAFIFFIYLECIKPRLESKNN